MRPSIFNSLCSTKTASIAGRGGGLLGDLEQIRIGPCHRLPGLQREQRHQDFDANLIAADVDECLSGEQAAR